MKQFGNLMIAGAAMAGLWGGAAQGQTVTNGGFEGGPAAGNGQPVNVGDTTIAGWTVVNGSNSTTGGGKEIAWLGDGAYGYNTPFGTDYLDLTGYSGSTGDSGVSQAISTAIGGVYTLSFYLGGHAGSGPVSVNVFAGSQTGLITDPITDGITAGTTLWSLETFDFTATSASTVVSIIGNNSGQDFIGLDNVSIRAVSVPGAVPETASWAMMILGMGAVGFAMRRRKVTARVSYTA